MVVEPVGTTLAVLGLLQPIFVTCRELYKGYQITQSFGDDFDIAKRRLEIQYARLEGISRKKMRFLKNDFEPFDKDHPITKAIISHLVVMRTHFQICNRVLKKYHDLGMASPNELHVAPVETPTDIDEEQEEVDQTNDATITSVEDAETEATPSAVQIPQLVLPPTVKNSSPDEVAQSPPSKSFVRKLRRNLQRLERFSRRSASGGTESPLSVGDQSLAQTSTNASTQDATADSTPPASLGHLTEAPTPATTISPSILESSSVRDDENTHESRAKKLKTSNRFLRRVVWAADDKTLIYSEIDELRNCNNELESLLQLRPPEGIQEILASGDRCAPVQELSEIQASIWRFHKALAAANNKRAGKDVRINVQLRAGCRDLFEKLPEDHELKFRNGSYLFLLHVHGISGDSVPDSALELLVETPSSTDQGTITLQPLPSLSDLKGVLEGLPEDAVYKQVGTLVHNTSSQNVHQIITTERSPRYKVDDLANVLSSANFREKLTPIQRISLASTIAITHLYFANVRVTCTEVSPVNIVYYNESNNPFEWDDLDPFVLNPYLSVGLGSRKPQAKLGLSSGRFVQKNNVIAELGLLLYQIGSNTRFDYGQKQKPEEFRSAKERALESIHAIDEKIGPRYAEITQRCLEWKTASLDTSPVDDDWQVIQGVVAWLMDFQTKLES